MREIFCEIYENFLTLRERKREFCKAKLGKQAKGLRLIATREFYHKKRTDVISPVWSAVCKVQGCTAYRAWSKSQRDALLTEFVAALAGCLPKTRAMENFITSNA